MEGVELLAELRKRFLQRRGGEDGNRSRCRRRRRVSRAGRRAWASGTTPGAASQRTCHHCGSDDGQTTHYELLGEVSPERDQRILGISTDTLVALTAATASMPGSRPSSSAASRLSSDTNLCGPAWIST